MGRVRRIGGGRRFEMVKAAYALILIVSEFDSWLKNVREHGVDWMRFVRSVALAGQARAIPVCVLD
jgi:hypothetical protein